MNNLGVSISADKFDTEIIRLAEPSLSAKNLKHHEISALQQVNSFGSFLHKINEIKEPAFNKTKQYKELKARVKQKKMKEREQEEEKEKYILELFTHSSKSSQAYIDPKMFDDKITRKVLKSNKRSFGGSKEKLLFPEIKPNLVRKNLLSSPIAKKQLQGILYNNTYRHSNLWRNKKILKEIEVKIPTASILSAKNEDKFQKIDESKGLDIEIKERIDKWTLEYGQVKKRLVRFLYKSKNY